MRLVQCATCSMVFAAEVPQEMQSGTFYDDIGKTFYLSQDKLKGDYSPVRFSREIKIFHRFCPAGRVLDIGCSSGGFLYYLDQTHPGKYERLGNDVSLPALEYAGKQGVPTLPGDILSLELLPGSFDAVCFWAVLEHLADPRKFITRAHQLLKPNGLCFTLVPNFQSLAQRVLGSKYRYVLPQHVNYFTSTTLEKLMEDQFTIELSTTTHFNPIVIAQDLRSTKPAHDEDRAKLLVQTNRMKQNKLLLPVKWGYGMLEKVLGAARLADNCLVVVRKKN